MVSKIENIENPVPLLHEPNTDIQNILQNQSVLFELMGNVIENQKKIMNEIANLSIQIEESNRNYKTKVNLTKASDADNNSFILKQIKSEKDLEDMELLLSDNEQKLKLIRSCSIICSGGKGKGTTCAYRFLDVLFSREFLCECSWSGSTRGDGVKISLKCYKKTLNFFFTMINQWDNEFTQEENDIFFKNILKNAKKRKGVKYDRIPTKRQRSKKTSRNDERKTTEDDFKEEQTEEKEVKEDIRNNGSEEEESLLC
ncbi:uncharacterized protein LOC106130352 [Amyelois transitella]|uniref:uncharacterized protein LOC106130352 n=1 Tax=Amyelois transitella TaxID=680683 RepID=UPI00067E0D00|nr:uncharacterized protein LOC106130352 [Amyelois transitella]